MWFFDNSVLCFKNIVFCFRNCLLCLQIWATVQELKPKVQSNSSLLIVHLFLDVDTVNTVGSHLKT